MMPIKMLNIIKPVCIIKKEKDSLLLSNKNCQYHISDSKKLSHHHFDTSRYCSDIGIIPDKVLGSPDNS